MLLILLAFLLSAFPVSKANIYANLQFNLDVYSCTQNYYLQQKNSLRDFYELL